MTTPRHADLLLVEAERSVLNKRIEDIGWGLLLIMTGAIWLVPEDQVPRGSWLIGTGILLLALNVVRYFKGAGVPVFTTVLGILLLGAGLAAYLGTALPVLAICLIVLGAGAILRPLATPRS